MQGASKTVSIMGLADGGKTWTTVAADSGAIDSLAIADVGHILAGTGGI